MIDVRLARVGLRCLGLSVDQPVVGHDRSFPAVCWTRTGHAGQAETALASNCPIFLCGEVAERSKAAVLKTADPHGSGGSNPSLSASRIATFRCLWRGGRVAEGAPLLREYRLIPYRGFESLPLRQRVLGEMAERSKARAWRARVPKGTVGSNPTLSAILLTRGDRIDSATLPARP